MDMDINIQCGSPAGMGQLIKYFESQSRRLDRQSFHSLPSCLNSDFESLIKFSGVPILPPAITSSRRDELRQYKKDAILLEKRHRARQRRQMGGKSDSGILEGEKTYLDNGGTRPAARVLNFDSEHQHGAGLTAGSIKERLSATNPLSTFATTDTTGNVDGEEFGLQTMDTMNSELMTSVFTSLDAESVPTVFSGFKLNSYKEQKISYDLDRLSKVLNVQEMNSTSGSDLSDALANTQTSEDDQQKVARWAQQLMAQKSAAEGRSVPSESFCHESQDTVVEVLHDLGGVSTSVEDATATSATSGLVDTSNFTMEQSGASVNKSPGCGMTNTIDSQRSSRSSPKSLKNAVHFASFVTEYNTSASQSFESTRIVTKKLSADQTPNKNSYNTSSSGVLPIIGDPSEVRAKQTHSKKCLVPLDQPSGPGLLGRVSLNPDSDSSATSSTPPCDPMSGVPFQGYGRKGSFSSDKENTPKPKLCQQSTSESHEVREEDISTDDDEHSAEDNIGRPTVTSKRNNLSPNVGSRSEHDSQISATGMSVGVGPPAAQFCSHHRLVGASHQVQQPSSHGAGPSSVRSSVTASGDVSTGHMSVTDSQASTKSNTLTATSESSSSTIRDDASVKDSTNLALNIVETGHGKVIVQGPSVDMCNSSFKTETPNSVNHKEETAHSPKKLNVSPSKITRELSPEGNSTPKRLIRSGSYTLNEPSPALIKARSKLEAQDRNRESHDSRKEQTEDFIVDDSNNEEETLSKKLNFESPPEVQHLQHLPSDGHHVPQHVPQHVPSDPGIDIPPPHEAEREGKAEHINRYLSQVQLQNSMNISHQSWDHSQGEHEEECLLPREIEDAESMVSKSILDIMSSLSDGQSLDLDAAQLTSLHHERMEQAKREMMEKQEREMEELFVQQRRETMLLAAEIKAAQQLEREQQEFLILNAPENIKVEARGHAGQAGELSPEHTEHTTEHTSNLDMSASHDMEEAMNSLHNRRPQSQLKSSQGSVKTGHMTISRPALRRKSPSTYFNTSSDSFVTEGHQTRVKTVSSDDSFSPRAAPPRDPPVHMGRSVPDFSPSPNSPRMQRSSVLRSPLKLPSAGREGRVIVPPEARSPEMRAAFDRVSAVAKGFLTRCLLRSDKVTELMKTIKDTREFAFNFQTETPIKKGVFSSQDRVLLERIIAQLQAALLDIHEIFFEIPTSERMGLIEQTRLKEQDKRIRLSKDSVRGSGPRISQATLKALERKRKAKEAEASAMLSVSSTSRQGTARPGTAPSGGDPSTHTDLRALKPLQGQGHSQVSARSDSNRAEKERPRTAPEKQLTRPKRITAQPQSKPSVSSVGEVNKDLLKDGSSTSKPGSVSNKSMLKPKVTSSSRPNQASASAVSRPNKSWR